MYEYKRRRSENGSNFFSIHPTTSFIPPIPFTSSLSTLFLFSILFFFIFKNIYSFIFVFFFYPLRKKPPLDMDRTLSLARSERAYAYRPTEKEQHIITRQFLRVVPRDMHRHSLRIEALRQSEKKKGKNPMSEKRRIPIYMYWLYIGKLWLCYSGSLLRGLRR